MCETGRKNLGEICFPRLLIWITTELYTCELVLLDILFDIFSSFEILTSLLYHFPRTKIAKQEQEIQQEWEIFATFLVLRL